MKPVSTAVYNAIRSDHDVYALPRLRAEFNMNRYINTTVDNTPAETDEGNDIEMFPIESIVEPMRPRKGVIKARVGESLVADDYSTTWRPRFYTASVDDKYKYWTGPGPSDGTGAITNIAPHVIYDTDVRVNKIVVGLENTWASPVEHQIHVTTDGTTWTAVSTNPAIDNDGRISLWWDGAAWVNAEPADLENFTNIRGIRYTVTRLGAGRQIDGSVTQYKVKNTLSPDYTTYNTTGANSHFNLIELSARCEIDLSDRLVSVSDTFDLAEASNLYPVGTLTSNVGEISLWNGDNYLNKENPSNPIAPFLDANVEVRLTYIYDVGGFKHEVPQFKMYSGVWAGTSSDNVSVQLSDHSTFFQEATPNPAMWENLTVPEIVWRICDSVGFVDYIMDEDDKASQHVIPTFWVTGEQTVWEIFDELAKGTQTAIYFDSYGFLQVKTRQAAFDDSKQPVWTLRSDDTETELSDIISTNQTEEFNSNVVRVSYQTTKWSEIRDGIPAMQIVWEPEEETQTLRASPLSVTLETTDTFFRIPAADAKIWPYEGVVNIQGELIKYSGKQFRYYTGATGDTANYVNVENEADYKKYDAETLAEHRHKNGFTGNMVIAERGLWNSEAKRHPVDAEGYSVRHVVNGNRRLDVAGFNHNRAQSKVTMNTPGRFKDRKDVLFATRGNSGDTGFFYYGTRFNFVRESGRSEQTAGLLIHNNGGAENGYYIEVKASNKISSAQRKNRHEVLLYSRFEGKNYRIGPNKGAAVAIAEDVEVDLDIYIDNNHTISVWVNGRKVIEAQVPSSRRNTKGGKFGLFAKGKTKVQFEYLYAITRDKNPPPDDATFLDRVRGEYTGYQWDREWVYDWRNLTRRERKKSSRKQKRWNQMFMDDFGPYAHEIREYNVKFDPSPVLHSRLYMSNDWSIVCTEYRADAFGAKIVIANTARQNAVFHGEETLTFAGSDEAISHVFTVLGRPLIIAEGEEVVARNDAQIRRRGEVEVEIKSQWVQSKEAADDIANWIKDHWGVGSENLSVEVFGNPLIEIGDVVEIEYPRKNMFASTHRYFVTGTSNSFEQGITTSLTLRRVV